MPLCCTCNTRGRCLNCACAKNGQSCSNSQPNRVGKCTNQEANQQIPSERNLSDSPAQQDNVFDDPVQDPSQPTVQNNYDLPPFLPLETPNFRWNQFVDGQTFMNSVDKAYQEIVHWRHNIFSLPSGKAGQEFVSEMSRLFRASGESTALEAVAIKAATILPPLLLQKPHARARVKDHILCLQRRLGLWREGNISELLREGNTIQQRLTMLRTSRSHKQGSLAKSFAKFMRRGKVKAAMKILSSSEASLLSIHDEVNTANPGESITVLDELKAKHPPRSEVNPNTVLPDHGKDFHPVLFDCIDAESIRKAALRTNGGAGPSGTDASFWKRICTSFRLASDDLCTSLALVARKIATTYVDPAGLSSFTACRLIALDKMPGVRPIGIGEVSRGIISKAIISVIQDEIKEIAGTTQLCAGQEAGCEAGVHAVREIFENSTSEGALFVNATNAFNSLNRQTALLNIHSLCPSLAIVLTNTYRNNSSLFIEGQTILSCEGTTQGDPLASAMYALGVIPLIRKLQHLAQQLWFADDASAAGHGGRS